MEIIAMAVLAAATVSFIAIPVIKKDTSGEEVADIDLTLAKLEEEKESAYNALKEAEFDYETGKLSDEDYQTVKTKYSAKAVEAIQQLEEYREQPSAVSSQPSADHAKFCGSCGATLEKGTKFCGSCGNKVS